MKIAVVYYLGIYLLNLFIAFLQPQFDPSNEVADDQMEGGTAGNLPTTRDEEFRPFIRLLPEFKFWYKGTRALVIAHICTWMPIFDVPVYWPILFFYWLILFIVPSKSRGGDKVMRLYTDGVISAETDSTYDQISIRALLDWKD